MCAQNKKHTGGPGCPGFPGGPWVPGLPYVINKNQTGFSNCDELYIQTPNINHNYPGTYKSKQNRI